MINKVLRNVFGWKKFEDVAFKNCKEDETEKSYCPSAIDAFFNGDNKLEIESELMIVMVMG